MHRETAQHETRARTVQLPTRRCVGHVRFVSACDHNIVQIENAVTGDPAMCPICLAARLAEAQGLLRAWLVDIHGEGLTRRTEQFVNLERVYRQTTGLHEYVDSTPALSVLAGRSVFTLPADACGEWWILDAEWRTLESGKITAGRCVPEPRALAYGESFRFELS